MSRVVVQPVPQPPYRIAARSLRRSLSTGSDAEGSLVAHPARRSAGPGGPSPCRIFVRT